MFGPIFGAALVVIIKDVASAYIERWNFMLGAIFVLIVVFMPEGFVARFGAAVALGDRGAPPASPPSVLTEERAP